MKRMKLWLRSSLDRLVFFERPSISSISLKDKIRVCKFTRPFKFSIFLILLLNRLRYTILVRSRSRLMLITIGSVIASIYERIGISGGIAFSTAA